MAVKMPDLTYTYKAKYVKTVDGDTVDVFLDVGFHAHRRERLRLLRVDTPEMNSKNAAERSKAKLAKSHVHAFLACAREIRVQTHKSDAFGRYLAEIWYRVDSDYAGWDNLGDVLLQMKLGKLWKKKRRK